MYVISNYPFKTIIVRTYQWYLKHFSKPSLNISENDTVTLHNIEVSINIEIGVTWSVEPITFLSESIHFSIVINESVEILSMFCFVYEIDVLRPTMSSAHY